MKKILISLIIVLIHAAHALAAEYYCRADGNTTSYTSATGPCNSINQCMTLSTLRHAGDVFAPGDIIYLCDDGGKFKKTGEFISSNSDGSSTDGFITYMAFPGDTPVIDGADKVSVESWTSEGLNWYWEPPPNGSGNSRIEPMQVWENNKRLTWQEWVENNPIDGSGQWSWDSANQRVYIRPLDGRLDDEEIDVGQRNLGISISNQEYIIVDGITVEKIAAKGNDVTNPLQDSNGDYLAYTIYTNNCSNIIVRNCTTRQMGGGKYFDGVSGENTNWSSGIEFYNSDACEAYNNIVYDGHCVGLDPETINVNATVGYSMYNNRVYDIDGAGLFLPASGGSFHNNYFSNCGLNHSWVACQRTIHIGGSHKLPIRVHSNYLEKNDVGIRIYNSQNANILISYNIITDYLYSGIRITDNSDNIDVFNNVIYDTNGSTIGALTVATGLGSCDNIVFRNNIAYVDNQLIVNCPSSDSFPTFDYNCYYRMNAGDAFSWKGATNSFANFEQYIADSGQDGNTQYADPLFVNASASDFHLYETSKCIDNGVNVNLTQDFDGVSVPQGSGVDIGAFEYPTDIILPTGTISINNGALVTNSLNVLLTLFATYGEQEFGDNALMSFSNDNLEWSDPEPYANTKIWTLSPGEGVKTVYVKFRNAAGDWMTEPVQDQIIYETTETACEDPQKLQPVTITASSQFGPFYAKDKAVDGNPSTTWSTFLSIFKKDEFFTLDLGEIKKISGLNMYASQLFGTDYFPTNFQIEISSDNITWKVISSEQGYTTPIQPGNPDSWTFNSLDCRYVRIYITKTKNILLFFHVAQISEIEIYGCDIVSQVSLPTEKNTLIKPEQLEKNHLKESKDINNLDQIPPTTPGKPRITFPE